MPAGMERDELAVRILITAESARRPMSDLSPRTHYLGSKG
jgi:hypothetical protein